MHLFRMVSGEHVCMCAQVILTYHVHVNKSELHSGQYACSVHMFVFTFTFTTFCTCCSHGEALTFEPLLMREEESVLRDFSVLAIATVTQVIFLKLTPTVEPLTSHPLKVCVYMWYTCYVLHVCTVNAVHFSRAEQAHLVMTMG